MSTAVLVSVVEQLPSPPVAQATRFPDLVEKSPGARYVSSDVKEAMVKFKTSSHDPVVGYVSKMISVPFRDLPENNRRNFGSVEARRKVTLDANRQETPLSHETSPGEHSNNAEDGLATKIGSLEIKSESEQLIGFCRLYSGRLSVGDSVFVLPPKFSPANPHATPQPKQVVVKALYLLMGKGLEILKTVPAGVVFGIAGLEGHILKSGTLCSRLEGGVNLAGLSMGSEPIVRVALEPVNPRDLGKMIDGLRRLQHSDACARYEVLENGEHVILGAGELHLERCIKDLTERFARCEVQAGEPIVPYRESVIAAPEMAPIKNSNFPRGTAIGSTASKQITIRLRVRPLPSILTDFLERNSATIRKIYLNSNDGRLRPSEGQSMIPASAEDFSVESMNIAESEATISLPSFKREFQRCLAGYLENSEPCLRNLDEIVAFGPRRIGPNILVDSTGTGIFRNL